MDDCISNVCAAQNCGQTQGPSNLTDQMTDRFASLVVQAQHIRDLVCKARDVLGIYNMPAQIGAESKQSLEPEPVQSTLSNIARKMNKLIDQNDRTIGDFENLLKNL